MNIHIDEQLISAMCQKYHMKYKIFEGTGTILIEGGLDDWKIIVDNKRYRDKTKRPIALLHRNKYNNHNLYHKQRSLNTMEQCLDCIVNHRGLLTKVYNPQYIPYKHQSHQLMI